MLAKKVLSDFDMYRTYLTDKQAYGTVSLPVVTDLTKQFDKRLSDKALLDC